MRESIAVLASCSACGTMQPTTLWIATFSDEHRLRRNDAGRPFSHLNAASESSDALRMLEPPELSPMWQRVHALSPEPLIVGIVTASVGEVFHHLVQLTSADLEQYNVWQQLLGVDLAGHLDSFHAFTAHLLSEPFFLHQCSDSRSLGMVVSAEPGLGNRIAASDPGLKAWAGRLLEAVVRLPRAVAVLIATGRYPRCWLPNLAGHRGRWGFDVPRLGIQSRDLPALPEFARAEGPPLDCDMMAQIADAARLLTRLADLNASDTADVELLQFAHRCAAILQRYRDESSASGLALHLEAADCKHTRLVV